MEIEVHYEKITKAQNIFGVSLYGRYRNTGKIQYKRNNN